MPVCSSSTSMMTSSTGSSFSPVAASLSKTTRGRDTASSKPSRRIVSIRMPSCNSPRPATSKASLSCVFGDLERDIALRLAQQPVADDAALHLVALAAGKRAVIDAEGHGEGRRIDRLGRRSARSPADRRACRRRCALVSPAIATMSPASPRRSAGAPGRGRRAPSTRGRSRPARRRG